MPIITCPKDIGPLQTDSGHPYREVTWDIPIASDNSRQVFVVRSDGTDVRQNRLRAPIGETVVAYNATDPSGNKDYCSFTIIIQGEVTITG